MYIFKIIYLYWIYAANIWRTYVSRIFTLLQSQTVQFLGADSWAPGLNCWGANLRGPPIAPETQPPLVHKLKKNKEADLVPYQLYFKAGLHTKQMMIMYTDIN